MFAAPLIAVALSTVAASPRGAVATAHPLASAIAAGVLRDGGNAVDAAVAAAFALAVVEPQSSGIGGGGFALVWSTRERAARVLDFREVAPGAATPDLFVPQGAPARSSLDGGLAVAVPGAARGYAELARRYGTRPLRQLVEPAARLAERGFRVSHVFAERSRMRLDCLRQDSAAAREFLAQGGTTPLEAGARLVRKDLARTLRLLARDPDALYRGALARRIARAVQGRGGVLTEADLGAYRTRDRAPLEGSYRGWRVISMPPPSAGGAIVLGVLGALEGEDARAGGYRPEHYLHVMLEAEKRLHARRAALLGDPDQVAGARAAAEQMASPAYGTRLRASIGERATPVAELGGGEAGDTSHVSVIDAAGNAVALTTTINFPFGSCVVVPGTGILLNDEMDDFDAHPGAPNAWGLAGAGPNLVAPGKRPLSSMAPTLVFDPGGRLALVVGAAGGSRIPTAVVQAILHIVDDGMRVDEALAAPRLSHQLIPDEVQVEPNGLEAATVARLQARGHVLSFRRRLEANAQAVSVTPAGEREGAADPRYEGAAAVP